MPRANRLRAASSALAGVADFDTGQQRCFALVGNQQVDAGVQRIGKNAGRGGVEQDRNARLPGDRDRGTDRVQRNFELEHQQRGLLDQRTTLLDVAGREPAVGARREHDAVLADVLDQDHRDSGRGLLGVLDPFDVYAIGEQSFAQRSPEGVGSDASDHRHCASESGTGYGLVRALSSRQCVEAVTGSGFLPHWGYARCASPDPC